MYDKNSQNNIENLNKKDTRETRDNEDTRDTIIHFNIEDLNKDYIKSNSRWNSLRIRDEGHSSQVEKKQLNISPIVRRTPNTKADIIIQKIYTNRKNVIKNYQNTSTNFSLSSNRNLDKNRSSSKEFISDKNKVDINLQNNDRLYNYESDTNLVNNTNNLILSYKDPIVRESFSNSISSMAQDEDLSSKIINKKNDDSPSIKESSSSDEGTSSRIVDRSPPDKSVTPLSDESVNSDIYCQNIFNRNVEKRDDSLRPKRRYYRTIKLKKNKKCNDISDENKLITHININETETPESSPSPSPRDITQDLWNDSVENYYIEFQKLCKEEAEKYKYLSHRNELISNLLKFILLISGCFTFTLSISTPGTLFMSTTTTVSSCLTAIITSLTGFFQFDKKSEIQYNIYR